MGTRRIYVQNPQTGEISAHQVDIAQLASWAGGGHDPNFQWRNDEAFQYVTGTGIAAEDVMIPHHAYLANDTPDPNLNSTFSKKGAAAWLGIARQTFIERLRLHPLEMRALHDGKPAYRAADLLAWDRKIKG